MLIDLGVYTNITLCGVTALLPPLHWGASLLLRREKSFLCLFLYTLSVFVSKNVCQFDEHVVSLTVGKAIRLPKDLI